MPISAMVDLALLKYEKANLKVMKQDTIFGVLDVYEYELFLDNYSVGVMEMAMDDIHVFIFNVLLEEEYRGNGLFSGWLNSLDKIIIAFQPIQDAIPYWNKVADETHD